ncbi:G-protein coupled receptor 35-like [Ascaphus truei]|uniref:G-protein coupled receptor 35-like n=1 Tax=Ascaphus truei TaxID=8439 RepID=UPI003F5A8A93
MNCSNSSSGRSLQLFNLLAYIPLLFFGSICSALALWVFCCKLKKWTETRVYMVNLIISDISLLLTFPFRLVSYLYDWNLGSDLCKAIFFQYFVNMYMSIFTITLIAVDRYFAIRHPLKAKGCRSPLKAIITCCVLWLLCISIGIMRIVQDRDHRFRTCFQKVSTRPFNLALVFVVVGFVTPLTLMSFCSGMVISTLWNKETVGAQEQQSIRKAIHMITANLVVFVICFLPVHVGYTVRFVTESLNVSCHTWEHIDVFIQIATFVANSNCVLDSVCYYFGAREFWEASRLLPMLRHLRS